MKAFRKQAGYALAIFLFWVGMVVWTVSAWVTHVVHCVQNEQWLFLIAGAIAAPIAVIHGTGLWFGVF